MSKDIIIAEGEIQLSTNGKGSLNGIYLNTGKNCIWLNKLIPENKASFYDGKKVILKLV